MGNKRCGDGDGDDLLLSEDVLIQEILVCLPVKSLLRFKSVCKSWRQLIQTPFFIDLHTTTSSSSSSKFGDTTFILQTIEPSHDKYKYEADIKLYMLSSSSGSDGDQKKKKMVFKVDDLGFLPFYKNFLLHDTLRMVGSCNGIICLHDPELLEEDRGCTKQHYTNLRDVCLWNPATRHFRILPKSIPIEEGKHGVGAIQVYGTFVEDFVAFGFDVKNNDYKVFRITSFIQDWDVEGCMCHVQVYSLSTDSWRLLEGINSLPAIPSQNHFENHGIYLNGSYFFVGRKFVYGKSDSMMLSFDFTKEIFTTMQLPDNNSHVLSCLGEKLAVFTTVPQIDDYDGDYEYYDIWVLNEKNGSILLVNKEFWTKLRSFRIKRQPYSEPRCISNNGEFAFISSGYNDGRTNKLQLFNLVTKEAEKDFLIGTQMCRADVYKESLVSIMGGGNVLLRWQLPTHGTTYKLNLDAPFIDYGCPFGIGLCLTSDTGGCIGVRSLYAYVRDAIEGEAMAMLEAIKWVKMWELSPIIIESDSKNVVSFFMEDDDDSTCWSSEALSFLGEAKLLLNSSELDISFQYCSRSCNYVADIAAKLGREGCCAKLGSEGCWTCKEWTANSPGEIVMSLNMDLGLVTKNYWAFDSGLETENYWASDSGLETDKGWASDSGLEMEKGWASDSGLEIEKGWAKYSGLETDKGWASE